MNSVSFKAFLIDLDGTLLDTERLYTECLIEASIALGKPLDRDIVYSLAGLSAHEHYEALNKILDADSFIDELKEVTYTSFYRSLNERTPVKPDAKAFLTLLNDKGIPFAIATNTRSDHALERIENSDIGGLTTHIYGADLVDNPKPAPDIYLHAASMLGVAPEESVAIEDSEAGVSAALAAKTNVAHIPDLRPISEHLVRKCSLKTDSLKTLSAILLSKREPRAVNAARK